MKNTQLQARIDALDYVRGFALLGIIFMNIVPLLMLHELPVPQSIDASYQRFLYLFVEGRFYSIFSFLIGVGFYIFITRAQSKGNNGYVLFLRRIIVLFGMGFVHQMFQPGEALALYAICGLLILPFYKLNKRINLIIGILGIIIFGYLGQKMLMTFPLILLGLAAGQYLVFEQLADKVKQLSIFTAVFLLLSIAGLIYQYQQAPEAPFFPMMMGGDLDPVLMQVNKFMSLGILIGPIVSACFIGIILLLLQFKAMQTMLAPLKYYGRMALTNYIGQTALILLANHWFDLAGITLMQSFYLCIAIHAVLITFSVVWLSIFKMGPLEWLWRAGTYLKFPPLLNNKQ